VLFEPQEVSVFLCPLGQRNRKAAAFSQLIHAVRWEPSAGVTGCPEGFVEFPSLEILKTRLDTVLCSLL